MSAAIRPACTLSVVNIEVKAAVSAADWIPMILTFLAAASIGRPSAANCAGAITTAAGFAATALSRMLICPATSDTQLHDLDAQLLAGFARPRKHRLPIERCR